MAVSVITRYTKYVPHHFTTYFHIFPIFKVIVLVLFLGKRSLLCGKSKPHKKKNNQFKINSYLRECSSRLVDVMKELKNLLLNSLSPYHLRNFIEEYFIGMTMAGVIVFR